MVQYDMFSQESGAGSASAAPVIQSASVQSGSIFDRAVLLSLTIKTLGTKRKVQSSEVEVEADKSYIHVSKDILKSELLEDIKKFDGRIRTWLAERSLPSLFRSGMYLWPLGLVVEADDYLRQRQEIRQPMIDRFCDAYVALKADAQVRLGALYNPREYPAVEAVRRSFGISYHFMECSPASRLRDISVEMFERERNKQESVWREAIEEAKQLLFSQFAGLAAHMADRLAPSEDGSRKRFNASLVPNFQEFLRLWDSRNAVVNSTELYAVIQRCKSLLQGVTTEQVKDCDSLRSSLAASFAEISNQVSSYVQDADRRIILDEPETSADVSVGDRFGDI